jgi:DNA-binding response OmpR family regulator
MPPQHDSTTPHTSTGTDAVAGSGNVLVVEDDDGIRRLIGYVLARAGYAITPVDGRAEAEAAIATVSEPFVAAVVDLCLPDGRGDQVVQLLREQSPATRVVVTSAYAHASAMLQAAAESGDAFLTKPFSTTELLAMVSAQRRAAAK